MTDHPGIRNTPPSVWLRLRRSLWSVQEAWSFLAVDNAQDSQNVFQVLPQTGNLSFKLFDLLRVVIYYLFNAV
jgi:hypothetical protein